MTQIIMICKGSINALAVYAGIQEFSNVLLLFSHASNRPTKFFWSFRNDAGVATVQVRRAPDPAHGSFASCPMRQWSCRRRVRPHPGALHRDAVRNAPDYSGFLRGAGAR